MSSKLSKTCVFPLLLAFGCSGEFIDFGEEPQATSLEGTWVGQLSSDAVLSPKRVELRLDAAGHGTLLVGETEKAPPTDPTRGYPEEAQADAAVVSGLILHLYDGVRYSLASVDVDAGKLSFELDVMEAFEPICVLQTPVETDLGHACLENSGGGVDDSGGTRVCYTGLTNSPDRREVDCLLLFLCSIDLVRGCRCSETSCGVGDSDRPARARFELALDDTGGTLEGTHRLSADGNTTAEGSLTLERVED